MNSSFEPSRKLLGWYALNARDLPWRHTREPYPIWISEIMLQQTRAQAVIPYFERFMRLFPNVHALAEAPEQAVLKAWEGLGYYTRARNLHAAAKMAANGFPETYEGIRALPGIGEYTAGAIASQAFQLPYAAVDANVLRVLGRFLGLHMPLEQAAYKRAVRELAQRWVEESEKPGDCNQALMELGALLCGRTPNCSPCPLHEECAARMAGEAASLPIRREKKPRAAEYWLVVIATRQSEVLVRKREEGLLRGLWEFPMLPMEADVPEALGLLGLTVLDRNKLFAKQHVFTHLIWHMEGVHAVVEGDAPEGMRFVNAQELEALPFASAISEYKASALKLLR